MAWQRWVGTTDRGQGGAGVMLCKELRESMVRESLDMINEDYSNQNKDQTNWYYDGTAVYTHLKWGSGEDLW